MVGGEVVGDVHGVLGVAGGFVVTTSPLRPRAVHYDFGSRTCRVYAFAARSEMRPVNDPLLITWVYARTTHTLHFWGDDGPQSVNLSTGSRQLVLTRKDDVGH